MIKSEKNIAFELKNISKTYYLKETTPSSILGYLKDPFSNKKKVVNALSDINLKVKKGEIIGIVGNNGSGKSTLLNIILGSILPDKNGRVISHGRIIRLALGLGIDKNLSARDNIYLNGSILGLSFKKISSIFHEIIDFAGLKDFIDTPLKFYSKGMIQRLTFAIAINANADIILLDEFFGGTGDQEFKKKSNEAFHNKIMENRTIVIVSHSLKIIKNNCSRVIWIENGKLIKEGPASEIIEDYKKNHNK